MHGSIYLRTRWIQLELFRGLLERGSGPRHRFFQVVLIELDAGEVHAERGARDRRTSEAEEWIDGELDAIDAVQLQAVRRQPPRKGRGMRTLLVAALDGVVGQEPGVAAAAQIGPG